MKTPVIIPAYKEADIIKRTLESLPPERVEPIVVVNGINEDDETARHARETGAQVVELEQQGKLPAVQHALRMLGDRALDPLIILDADTRPLLPKSWHLNMMKNLHSPSRLPIGVGGPVWLTDTDILTQSLYSVWMYKSSVAFNRGKEGLKRAGPNMGVNLGTVDTYEKVLALPHLWPAEDAAIMDLISEQGGKYRQPLSLGLCALTRKPVSMPPAIQRLRMSGEEANQKIFQGYTDRSAPGSRPYTPPE